MMEFVYVKDRLPEKYSLCIVWHLVKEKGGEEYLAINTHLAMYDYFDNVWRFVDNDEIVDEKKKGEIVKYFEIPRKYINEHISTGNALHRLWMRMRYGIRIVKEQG